MSSATITVEGFVTKDPEMRQAAGKNVVSVDVAHTPRKKDNGEWVDAGETIWFQVSFWDRDAQPIMDAVRKGTLVTITGQPELNVYTKQDGTPGVSVRIKFGTLGIIPRAASSAPQNAPQGQQGWAQAAPVQTAAPDAWGGGADNAELPF